MHAIIFSQRYKKLNMIESMWPLEEGTLSNGIIVTLYQYMLTSIAQAFNKWTPCYGVPWRKLYQITEKTSFIVY